jgi:DNA-directed RNA polymerase specialized sigma24 family protein
MKTTAARKKEVFEVQTTNEPIQDEFDDLVKHASRGDSRAIGAIAVALGPTLLEEARTVLGPFGEDAEEVLQDFLLCLLDRRLRFVPARGRAMPRMCRIIHIIAQQHRRERERDLGLDREHG